MKRLIISLVLMLALVFPATATVNSSINKTIVLGNGSQTAFSFTFIGVASAYMSVLLTDSGGVQTLLTQGSGATQYQISLNTPVQGAIWGIGGTVTYNPSGTPIPAGSTLTIYRTLPLTQAVNLQNLSSIAVLGKGAETGLDTGVMQGQQISETNNRAIVANIANSAAPLPLPPAAQLANKGICADGTGLNLVGCSLPTSGVISTAMQPVVNAATLALGRTAFGLGNLSTFNMGTGLQDDGVPSSGIDGARVNFTVSEVAGSQSVLAANHLTRYMATGALNFSMARANTLWSGFQFQVYALSAAVTISPQTQDTILGLSSGQALTVPSGYSVTLTTNAATSGTWWATITKLSPLPFTYTPTVYNVNGTFTYTPPAHATRLWVRFCGAGGSGGGTQGGNGQSGNNTSFGGIVANGGSGGLGGAGALGAPGGLGGLGGTSGTGSATFRLPGNGGAPGSFYASGTVSFGGQGGGGPWGGGGQGTFGNGGNSTGNCAGAGGAGSNGTNKSGGGGGGSGEYAELMISPPATSYSVIIGSGVTGGAGSIQAGGNSSAGYAVIFPFFD